MARYRLRFLLQEFDLPRGATLIGRSSDCHVTIEDPLVSREHARIVIDDDGPRCEDLGSRNGVKINGVIARGTTRLKDGDRLRIGTQELVFCTVGTATATPSAKTTGFLRYCASCRLPYPQELSACPACGATEQVDEDSSSNGPLGAAAQNTWGLQLMVEVMEKALRVDRTADAVRVVQRAKTQLEEQLAESGPFDTEQFHIFAAATLRVSVAAKDPAWACWIAHVYGQLKVPPSDAVLALFSDISTSNPVELGPPLADLLAVLRETLGAPAKDLSRPQIDAHRIAVARLETLLKSSAHPPPEDDDAPTEDTNPAIS